MLPSMLTAVDKNGMALGEASEILQDNKYLVLRAVSQYGNSIMYASERLQEDKDVYTTALKENPLSYRFLSNSVKKDMDVIYNIYSNSVKGYFDLCLHKYISLKNKKAFQNYEKIHKLSMKDVCDQFESLNVEYKKELNTSGMANIFVVNFECPFNHLLSLMDDKTLEKQQSDQQEVQQLITNQKIRNLDFVLKRKKKSRQLKM